MTSPLAERGGGHVHSSAATVEAPPYTPYDHNFHGHMFQTKMWRDYTNIWDGKRSIFPPPRVDRAWMEWVKMPDRAACLMRAKAHIQQARLKNRPAPLP